MNKSKYILLISFCEKWKNSNFSSSRILRVIEYIKYRALSAIEIFLVRVASTNQCSLNHETRTEKIVASLTSFPARINDCYFGIKTIFLQSMPPDRIVLWLADSQFPDHKLPDSFNTLVEKGLEIRFCDDLRSHKKYYYILQEQRPQELVITFDDDIIYHPKSIERVYTKHVEYKNAIICNESKIIGISQEANSILPYEKWGHPRDGHKTPNLYYSAMTGSGCLYPYGIWPLEMFNWSVIKDVAPTADDIWITFMAIYYNIPIICTDIVAKVYTTLSNSGVSLSQINCIENGNDETVQRILQKYPILTTKLLGK